MAFAEPYPNIRVQGKYRKKRTILCFQTSKSVIFVRMMELLSQYNLTGLAIGALTFFIIGLFHPLVIKGEYYFGVKCWWVFALSGVAAVAASVAVDDLFWSVLLAVWGASSFWSIGELFEQRKRVAKGWFPKRERRR